MRRISRVSNVVDKKFNKFTRDGFKFYSTQVKSSDMKESSEIPSKARVVIVGGGVIGTSVAYHLGKLGWGADTILLEQGQLTSGTTWHAAGLIETFGSL